jgi:hypothetical protein
METILPTLIGVSSIRSTDYKGDYAFDTSKSLIDQALDNSWISHAGEKHNQRIWANLGSPYVITILYYENYHDAPPPNNPPTTWGISITTGSRYDGAYEGSIWGSNIQPEAYGSYEGLTKLWEGEFTIHNNLNASDPQYINLNNGTQFQYYTIDINNNHTGNFGIGFRRLEWQT